MLAARFWAKGDIRVEEVPEPGPLAEGWVRVAVEACGICGTDVEEYRDGPVIIPAEPHPVTGGCPPLTLGHEVVGRVVEAGAGVTGLEPGRRVAVEGNIFCGTCWWCTRHRYQMCEVLASIGLMADGGLAEQVVAPAYMCIPYGDHVPAEHAALSEPLSVAVRAARTAGIGLGTNVGIVGTGTVGLLAIQTARLSGARRILAVDRVASRRKLAVHLGADLAVDPDDAFEAGLELSGGVGLDCTIEAAGNSAAANFAARLVRSTGKVVLLGVFPGEVRLDMMDLLLKEKQVLGCLSHVYDEDFTTAVDLIDRGRIDCEPFVTDRIGLADVVTKGILPLIEEPEEHLKIVVLPGG